MTEIMKFNVDRGRYHGHYEVLNLDYASASVHEPSIRNNVMITKNRFELTRSGVTTLRGCASKQIAR